MSGGFETVSTTGQAGLGFLASPEGQKIQQKVVDDLLLVYESTQEAWEKVITEEKSPYTVALVKEIFRYFAPIQLLPPRAAFRDFEVNGVQIPKGVSIYVNAQAVNHGMYKIQPSSVVISLVHGHSRNTVPDKSLYGEDADVFRPERWLDGDNNVPLPYNFSFGAGSRACPAIPISNRLLYAVFARILLQFKVEPPKSGALLDTNYITYNSDTTVQTCMPKKYSVRLVPRASETDSVMVRCFADSRRTMDEMQLN